jgi:hypothetical protein
MSAVRTGQAVWTVSDLHGWQDMGKAELRVNPSRQTALEEGTPQNRQGKNVQKGA